MTETSLVPVSRMVIEQRAWPRLQLNEERVQSCVDVRFLLRAESVEAVGVADLDQLATQGARRRLRRGPGRGRRRTRWGIHRGR